jgi:hypothetical protein
MNQNVKKRKSDKPQIERKNFRRLKHYVERTNYKKKLQALDSSRRAKAQAIMEQGILDLNLLGSNYCGKE